MKKIMSLSVFAFAIASTGFSQINFESMSLSDAMKKAEKEDKKIFIDVYTTWCGPCKAMDANVFSDKKVGERMAKEYVCLKVDYEKGEFKNDVIPYHIKGYPTMLIIDPKGLEIGRIYGSKTLDVFNLELDNYSTKKYSPVSQAFINLKDKSTGQKVWKESLVYLEDHINDILNTDLYHVYVKACEDYYKNFDITTYDGDGDLKIFRNVQLPLEHPVVQLYLKDTASDEYAHYRHKDYMVLSFTAKAEKAKTQAEIDEIKTRFHIYYEVHYNRLGGDVESEEYLLGKILAKTGVTKKESTEEKVIEEDKSDGKKKKKKKSK